MAPFVSRVAPFLKFRLNESNGAHFRCGAATDQKLAYGNFPRLLLEVHAGSGSTRCSFFICRSRNCRMHGGTRALLHRNGCFPGFRNSVWIFMSDHLDLAAADGISVSLTHPHERGYVRPFLVSIRSFFSRHPSRRPRNCYSRILL